MSFDERIQELLANYVPRPAEVVIDRWGQEIIDQLDHPSQYHALMRSLPDPIRRTIATELLLWQVNNGGFWQYFYNSYGITIDDAIEGLRTIGQERYAGLAERAKLLFGAHFPDDRIVRIAMVGDDQQAPRIDFKSIDDEFFALDPDVTGFAYDALDAYAKAEIDLNL